MKNVKIILRVLFIILSVIPIITFIIFNFAIKNNAGVFSNNTNILAFIIIELINILITILLFKNKNDVGVSFSIITLIYIVISIFIPVYSVVNTYAPSGENSYLMGQSVEKEYKNIYGIDITKIFNN